MPVVSIAGEFFMGLLRKAALAASMSTSLFACGVCAPVVHAQGQHAQDYHLPVQSLAASLRAVSMASGRTIGVPPQLVANRMAPALEGSFTAEAAVAALLAGSGLHLHAAGNGWIIDAGVTAEPPMSAPGPSDIAADGPGIVVTGSRIRGGPIASPTIVLDHAAMLDQGSTNLGDVMRELPQNFGGGQNPGIGANVPSASGTNVDSASTINLRGLGSDATLTLLDGHRLAYNASRQGIDITALPFGMIDRVEVVADGASALYGSDAVAGVANIILKHDYQGLEVSANLGGATDGGDFQQQYGVVTGHKWSTGGIVAAYEFSQNTNIFSNDRSYSAIRPGVVLYPSMHHHAAAISAHQALTDNLSFEVEAIYNKRWALTGFTLSTTGSWDASHEDQHSTSRSVAIAPTLKLQLPHDWRLTLSGTYGTETVTYLNNAFSGSTQYYSASACYCNQGKSVELGADGRLLSLPGGPVKLAVGTGYRTNSMNYFSGQGSPLNINASQSSTYAYGELSLPVVASVQEIPGIDRLNLSAAVRYERYPGIGSVSTPKLGLIYAPVPDLSFKGSWGRSFRAPTLYQQYSAQTMSLYPVASLGGTGYPATATAMRVSGGNVNLKPETAQSWAATVEYQPHAISGLHLQASYFSTVYKNRIVSPITYSTQALSNPLYAPYVNVSPSATDKAAAANNLVLFTDLTGGGYIPANVVAIVNNTNVNAGRQMIHGVDLLADYKMPLGGHGGHLNVTANVAYLSSSQQLTPLAAVTPLAGQLFNPPHWRGRASLTWSLGGIAINATTSVIGGVTDARTAKPIWVPGMVTQDVTLRYAFQQAGGVLHGLALSLTAQNLLNDKPSQIATSSYYETAYDTTNYSPVGRYIGMGVTKSW